MLVTSHYIQDWLKQFLPADRETAARMVEHLEFVSTSRLKNEIESQIIEIVKKYGLSTIIPIRALISDNEVYYPNAEGDILSYPPNIIPGPSKKNIEDFNPLILHPSENPGSEAIIAQQVTEIKRKLGRKILTGKKGLSASVSDMRSEKCSNLILVDDVMASGDRTKLFLRSLFKNRTLNSWISGGKIKVHVVVYMLSTSSLGIRKEFKQKIFFWHSCKMPTYNDLLPEECNQYKDLCLKYSTPSEKFPFGYKNTFARVIFEHSVPNNTPKIFWKGSEKLNPLFPSRSVPSGIKVENIWSEKEDKPSRATFFLALTALKLEPSISTPRRLARHMNWQTANTKEILNRLERNGLIDNNLRLTEAGEQELEYLGKRKVDIEFNHDYYYPR